MSIMTTNKNDATHHDEASSNDTLTELDSSQITSGEGHRSSAFNDADKSTRSSKKEQEERSQDDENKEGQEDGEKRKGPGKKPLIILGLVVIIMAIVALVWWLMTKDQISTDDAFTDGDAVTIAPKISGYVTNLAVKDNQLVKQGQLLVQIDPRDATAQRDQAKAEASLLNATADFRRQHGVDPRATSQQNIDSASAQLRSAKADLENAKAQVRVAAQVGLQIRQAETNVEARQQQVEQAKAQLETATLNLSYADVRAPYDGYVTMRNMQLGTLVQAGSSLFSIVSPHIWIAANFKESQLERMRPGNKVLVKIDAYPNIELHGHVDSVQQGTGSRFSAFPAENATGNYVKIVQRVPVKIVIDSGLDPKQPLPLGLSVDPTVTVE